MSAEEELKAFKLQALRRARVTAVVLGIGATLSVLSIIYGLTQNIEGNKQRDISVYAMRVSEKCEKEILEYKSRAEAAEREISDRNEADKLAAERATNLAGKKSNK